jgi:hypothetical protein
MRHWATFIMCFAVSGCAPEAEDFGIDEELAPIPATGKDDGPGRAGPKVATNTSATQVWIAKNKWEDKDASGLTWDQRYAKFVDSLEEVESADGHHTFLLTTPWGKTVEAPVLECAETAIFLRATFAAWNQLPFFMESQDGRGGRVYFGHFGIRTAAGKYARTPDFALAYKDHSSMTAEQLAQSGWPRDTKLRARAAAGGDDTQVFPQGEHFGAYLDEVHLNKRAGHLIIYLLNYFGSMNLSDTANTYNLVPEAIRPGDLLIHRWQKSGIGDAKMLKEVGKNAAGAMTAQLMSGSIPRRQPKIYDEVASKGYFMNDDTGGPGTNWDGHKYYKLGGGAKRWRVTKNINGSWTNTWMSGDEASWINDLDEARITARPAQFGALLGEVSPEEKRDALLRQIDDARQHLMKYPASCAARERRERAFDGLYELAARLRTTKAALDRQHRTLSDHVFAPLVYTESKTCCWNSSTAKMAEIVMDYAEKEQEGQCKAPTVFRSDGGYALWANHAQSLGRAAEWRAWSEDEPCAQRDRAEDTVMPSEASPWCE